MKHKKKPTRRQKLLLLENGLKPERWYIERDTNDYIVAISETGEMRRITKEASGNGKY